MHLKIREKKTLQNLPGKHQCLIFIQNQKSFNCSFLYRHAYIAVLENDILNGIICQKVNNNG